MISILHDIRGIPSWNLTTFFTFFLDVSATCHLGIQTLPCRLPLVAPNRILNIFIEPIITLYAELNSHVNYMEDLFS